MSYQCSVIQQESQNVLSVRTRSAVQDLPNVLGREYMKIFNYINELGESPSFAPFVGYFNMDMNDLDIEVGFPVAKELPGKDDINSSQIPAGRYATTIYTGPYRQIESAYNELMEWMDKNNYKSKDIAYEFYLNDPQVTPEEELQTKILISIE